MAEPVGNGRLTVFINYGNDRDEESTNVDESEFDNFVFVPSRLLVDGKAFEVESINEATQTCTVHSIKGTPRQLQLSFARTLELCKAYGM